MVFTTGMPCGAGKNRQIGTASMALANTPASPARRTLGSDVFEALRKMAISYEMKPGERLNELDLAEKLGVSRTPIREALKRLAAEGLLMESSRGYVRKPLEIQEMLSLYEARVAIERECFRLAYERATEDELRDISDYLKTSMQVPGDTKVEQLVELDEGFHLRIAAMSKNTELKRILISLNERIRFIRWIDMENVGRDSTQKEHREIVTALLERDMERGLACISSHISVRREQIVEKITKGLARIYIPA
jgi:DNA-binding GntR family transcriptional regulator